MRVVPDIKQGRSTLSPSQAEDLARSGFQLEATATELPSERGQNFRLRDKEGRSTVLKIFSTLEDPAHFDLQHRAMTRLEEAGLPVARTLGSMELEGDLGTHQVRLVSWLEGKPLGLYHPKSALMSQQVGALLAQSDVALSTISGEGALKNFQWDLMYAAQIIEAKIEAVPGSDRPLISYFLDLYRDNFGAISAELPSQVIHNDANDYNLLVDAAGEVSGLLDFGDIVESPRICNLAIAVAYLALHGEDPVDTMCAVTEGYHAESPLTEREISVIYPLVGARLAKSVCMSAAQRAEEPDNEYLSISEKHAWECLRKMREIHPRLATYRIRAALGWEAVPGSKEVRTWLAEHRDTFAPVVTGANPDAAPVFFDFSVASLEFGPTALTVPGHAATEIWNRTGDAVGVGRWDEPRLAYTGDAYATMSGERRTIHIGVDLFRPAEAGVQAPLAGRVHSKCVHHDEFDYGGCVILEHAPLDCPKFWTLYGHLSHASVNALEVGGQVEAGESFVRLGPFRENGGWVPHLHFQIVTDLLDLEGTFPGVATPSHCSTWHSLSPCPADLLGLGAAVAAPERASIESLLERRKQHIGSALSIAYSNKLHIVRGYEQYLYDAEGRAYLDAVNNVPHVGHSNPRVVEALQNQMQTLTTNTRYLHENILRYAERLSSTLPDPLEVCFFVNSGSEANDLALRLARTYTGKQDTIVLDGAYHGNLTTLIGISPYKFDGKGGSGKPGQTHMVPMPDAYRGPFKGMTRETGRAYAETIRDVSAKADAAAFIAESVPGCGGQIVPPPSYLREAAEHIREAGGVFIADEVQVGMGRAGSVFWGFELDGVVPDIVVIGKPIGNGHPLGAVVTTRAIADAFDNGMEYFNTFGGNPASCAVGLAVLDEIEDRGLQQHALEVGTVLLDGLTGLMDRHAIIGDVRGVGLFVGVELVLNGETLEPADEEASYVANRLRDNGILISTDGPLHNVLKIKPPMLFTSANAVQLVETLDTVLSENPVLNRLS